MSTHIRLTANIHKVVKAFTLSLVCLLVTTSPLQADKKAAGYFPDIAQLNNFKRGITTSAEVLEALGQPVGSGSSILPPDYKRREIYYYEQINITDMQNKSSPSGSYIYTEMKQSILAVLILDDKFDSFMWFSSDITAEGQG
jgi:outer membrane protein assembly factor BamE (lipoprotein component of BamABCDE complex)